MNTFRVRVVAGGKIVLPAALRRKHGFGVGDALVVEGIGFGALPGLATVAGTCAALIARGGK